jgi:DNA-binding Xre family transcriptional regulator
MAYNGINNNEMAAEMAIINNEMSIMWRNGSVMAS